MCKLLRHVHVLQTQRACLGKTSTLTRKKPHKTFKLSRITHTTPEREGGMEGEEDSNCNSRLHSRYSLVRLRVEVEVAASLIGLMHDKSWLWLGLTVHQMVMVSTGEGRGKGEGRGVACRSCDDSISISTPTPLAPHWQAKHLVTHRCRVQRGTWNYLATLCSSKLLPLPLLHIACHTYCVSSRYNYAYSMYLLRLLWLPSRLLDRTLKQTFADVASAVDAASSVCFAFRWQLLTGHQYTSLIRSVYKANQICKHRKWIMVCHYHHYHQHQPRQHDCDFLRHSKCVYQIHWNSNSNLNQLLRLFSHGESLKYEYFPVWHSLDVLTKLF